MKNLTLVISIIIGMALLGCKTKSKQEAQPKRAEKTIISDTFKLRANLVGDKVSVAVRTDLPDSTEIKITINRSYNIKDDSKEKTLRYFSKNTTVGEWKSSHYLPLNNEKWKKNLQKRQKKLLKTGKANKVGSVKYSVKISAMVSPDQFGKHNANLTGKAVNGSKIHSINDQTNIYYPIDYFTKSSQKSKSKTSPHIEVIKDVNIHLKANSNSTIVARAQKGDVFTLVKITDNWYQIYMFSGEPRYVRQTAANGTTTSPALPSSAMKACEKIDNAEGRSTDMAENKYPNDIYKKIDYSRILVDKFKLSIFHEYNIPPVKHSDLIVKCVKRRRNNYN
jgi:hypothetical protein